MPTSFLLLPTVALATLFSGLTSAQPATDELVPMKVSTRVLISSTAIELEKSVFDQREFGEMLREELSEPDVTMASLPSVVMKQNVPATIQVIRSKDEAPAWDGNQPLPTFRGWIMRLTPKPAGKEVHLRVQPAYGFVPGSHPVPGKHVPKAPDWDRIVTKSAEASAKLSSGQALAIPLGEVEPGVHITCFAQATPIAPTVTSAPDFSQRVPVPVHVPGILKAHATLIDLKGDEAFLDGDQSSDSFTIIAVLSPDQLALLLNERASKSKKLGSARIPTGELHQPWKEVEDVQITGLLNEVKTVIDLNLSMKQDGKAAFQTGISLYQGMVVLVSLPRDEADTRRLLAIRCETVE